MPPHSPGTCTAGPTGTSGSPCDPVLSLLGRCRRPPGPRWQRGRGPSRAATRKRLLILVRIVFVLSGLGLLVGSSGAAVGSGEPAASGHRDHVGSEGEGRQGRDEEEAADLGAHRVRPFRLRPSVPALWPGHRGDDCTLAPTVGPAIGSLLRALLISTTGPVRTSRAPIHRAGRQGPLRDGRWPVEHARRRPRWLDVRRRTNGDHVSRRSPAPVRPGPPQGGCRPPAWP